MVPCGTTGESPTLTHAEKNNLIEAAVAESKRMLVLAGTGGNCTRDAIDLTKHAENAGAHGSLQVCPYYNKPNQEGLFQHFSSIASAVDFPIILYNVPSRTSRDIAPDTVARLAKEHSNIVGIKEASASPEVWKSVRELAGEKFVILSGNDADTFPMMKDHAAKGVVSVASNVLPQRLADFTRLGLAGNFTGMEAEHRRLADFFDVLFIDTNPIMVKFAMNEMSLPAGGFRFPLCDSTQEKKQKMRAQMASLGLLTMPAIASA